MKVKSLSAVLTLIAMFLVAQPPATAETVGPSGWWRNCALWGLTDKCVESIEYFDDATGKWIPTTAEKNPDWVPNAVLTEEYRTAHTKVDQVLGKCGYWEAVDAADCYSAKGAGIKGEDLLLRTVVYGDKDEVKLSFSAFNGQNSYVRPGVGDRLFQMKPDSKWRITVISELFANDAGIAKAQMKEPNFEVIKGSDGRSRIRAEGRVQNIYTLEARNPGDPNCDSVINTKNDYTANQYSVAFSINIGRYIFEYEKLKGSPPAGVFITENGGCFSRLEFDTEKRIISVAVGAPHFDLDGKVIEGWVQASIRGDVLRKVFNAEPKTMNEAAIEVTYPDGSSKNATSTTRYFPDTDKVEIRAYGFTFSSPTIRMKLQPAVVMPPQPQPQPQTQQKVMETRRVVKIVCVKGKTRKTVSAYAPANPVCPKGYKKL